MFKKGDVVVAKDGFLDPGETLKDTLGIVVSYNPDNDYLVLGSIHPEKHAIPHTYSMRGSFYRKVTDKELSEFGLTESPVSKMVDRLLSGMDVREALSESEARPADFEKSAYSKLRTLLNSWGAYVGDKDQWLDFINEIAGKVWDAENVESDLPDFLAKIPKIDDHTLTDKDVKKIIDSVERYLYFINDETIEKVVHHNNYVEFILKPQYGVEKGYLYGVINKDGYPDAYNSNGYSCFLDFTEEQGLTQADVNKIRKG